MGRVFVGDRGGVRARRGVSVLAGIAALGGAVIGGCYSSLDGFSGGVLAQDGGSDRSSETPDPTSPGNDAGAPVDAGHFCLDQDAHTICDDFDGYRDASWTFVEQYSGASLVATSESFVSSPSSLALATPEVNGQTVGATLIKVFDRRSTRAHIEADIRSCRLERGFASFLYIQTTPTSGPVALVTMGITADGNFNPPRYETYIGNVVGATETFATAGAMLPSDRYSHVVLDVAFHATAGTVELHVDGAMRARLDNLALPTMVAEHAFYAGISTDDGAPCSARLDNVILDAQ